MFFIVKMMMMKINGMDIYKNYGYSYNKKLNTKHLFSLS